ncbi:MAG: hypothetical protein R2864_10245 [Syntrophotaleaceae bacterium]
MQGQLIVLVLTLAVTGLICGGLYTTVAVKISAEKKEIAKSIKRSNAFKRPLAR